MEITIVGIPLPLLIPYVLLTGVAVWAYQLIVKAQKDYKRVNSYWLDSFPSLFTTLGVFGTFLGIVLGLQDFRTEDIEGSIPQLLEGLKVSFWSSIVGIILSIVSSKWIEAVQFKNEFKNGQSNDELSALNNLNSKVDKLISSIASDADDSLLTQVIKLRSVTRDNLELIYKSSKEHTAVLQSVNAGIVGDGETSLLTQVQRMREEQHTIASETWLHVGEINKTVQNNGDIMAAKFDEFTKLLEKSNTEALVKAIENVIGGFNDRLNELIERLVKENFEELNNSVQQLNYWQQENKVQVETLINQYKEVAGEIQQSSSSLKDITGSTKKLVADGGRLETMIKELEAVISEENKLKDSIVTLNNTTEVFEKAANNLDRWMTDQKEFSGNVQNLIDSLKEIEKLRLQTDGFFSDIKENLNESVSIVHDGNKALMDQVDKLEESFTLRMNQSFMSLDKILQAMVMGYAERMNHQA